MKTINMFVVALAFALNAEAADVLTEKLQRGLFEEEANHNLDAAVKEYQSVIAQSDEQRKVTATALFRLGECYRKLGRTNEANAQYQRVLRDFSDQAQLAKLAKDLVKPLLAAADNQSELVPLELQRRLVDLRNEYTVQKREADRLPRMTREELFNSDTVKAASRVKFLRESELALEQKAAALKVQFSDEHPEVKSVEAQRKIIAARLEETLSGLIAGAEIRANSLAEQLKTLEAEVSKAETAASLAQSLRRETAATDEEEKEVRRIQAMIKDSPDLINARNNNGDTPLHRAAAAGQITVAKFLLANKADVNARRFPTQAGVSAGETALHYAAGAGHKSLVELLLDNGADVNATSPGGTPLHHAVRQGYRAVAEVLLAHQADVNAKDSGRETPLHFAVKKGFKALAELLLDKGADVNAKDVNSVTSLLLAAQAANESLVEFLLTRGASVDAARYDGRTALNLASYNGSASIIRLLLTNHADPNIADNQGITPLHWAVTDGDAVVAELLLKNKASITAKPATSNNNSTTKQNRRISRASPLFMAVNEDHAAVVELLLAYGADINAFEQWDNGYRTTVLHASAGNNQKKQMIKLLLEKKANPNLLNGDGWTPLMVAASYRANEIVELLLDHGAEVNVLSSGGQTALSLAESQWNGSPPSREIGQVLRQHGAIEDLQRSSSITIGRYSNRFTLFEKDTNGFNRFTLFESIAMHYTTAQFPNVFAFPDFSRVKIKRLKGKTPNEEQVLDLETAFKFGECTKDQWLEWGDLIEIPEQDHKVNQNWLSLSAETTTALNKCLDRKVKIIVKGQTNTVALSFGLTTPRQYVPGLVQSFSFSVPDALGAELPPPGTEKASEPEMKLTQHRLNEVVRGANVIRSSSDLSRVNVKRSDPITHEKREMTFDLRQADKRNDLWLRDGDVIEIPEKP